MSAYILNQDPDHQTQLRIGQLDALADQLGLPKYSALTKPSPQGVPDDLQAGVEAAARWVDQRRENFYAEHGSTDPDTGAVEYGSGPNGQIALEYDFELSEIAEGIRALAAATAAPQAEPQQPAPAGARDMLAKRLIGEVHEADAIATAACQGVAELPDRNSPEDWPEAMLVTHEELHMIVREAVIDAQTASAPVREAAEQPAGEYPPLPDFVGCIWPLIHAHGDAEASASIASTSEAIEGQLGVTLRAYADATLALREPHIIAAFLERTGQYVTNDATRDAAIAEAVAADRAARAAPTQVDVPKGFALVPTRPNRAMDDVMDAEGWQWGDLLAAAAGLEYFEAGDDTQVDAGAELAKVWDAVYSRIEEYVEGYEMHGEDESGREGYYTPTKSERGLILDAMHGLFADDEFSDAFRDALAAQGGQEAEPQHDVEFWRTGVLDWAERHGIENLVTWDQAKAAIVDALKTFAAHPPRTQVDALRRQHDADSAELRRLCAERDEARRQRDAALAIRKELGKLPRFSFIRGVRMNVVRTESRHGIWVAFDAVAQLFNPMPVDTDDAHHPKTDGEA